MIVTLYWCAALQPRGFKPGTIDSGAASPASQYSALVLAPRSSNPNLTTSYRCSAAPEQQSAQQLSSSAAQQLNTGQCSHASSPAISPAAVESLVRICHRSLCGRRGCGSGITAQHTKRLAGLLKSPPQSSVGCLEINVLTYSELS